jgi:phospholipid/cholesterol/gamma-HCH transport system substrate-binding protein
MSFARQASPYETTTQDRFMGAVLVISIIIGIYSLAQGSFLGSLTDKRVKAHSFFSQSYGILPGAEIKLSGILVGNVEEVQLIDRNKVRVSILLKPAYKDLYRQNSALKVNSSLGLNSVISGTGLEFIPGPENAPIVKSGTELQAIEPQSLDDILDEWNVKAMAQKAEQIVNDLATITQTLTANQQQIVDTMDNMATMTAATSLVIESLPPVIANIDRLVVDVSQTVNNLGEEAAGVSADVASLLQTSNELTKNLNSLVVELKPSIELMPGTLSQVNRVSRNTSTLLQTLNSHWLLGGSSDVSTPLPSTTQFTRDNSIYINGEGDTRQDGH